MKVETFEMKGWEDPEMGLVIDENNDWVLVKHIPVDYVIDGYRLYRKKFIAKRTASEKEEKVARVLQLKKTGTDAPANFEFKDTRGVLEWMQEHHELLEFQEEEESEVIYGRINKVTDGLLTVDYVDADGKVETEYDDFVMEQIRVIGFGNDYHGAVRLLWKDAASRN